MRKEIKIRIKELTDSYKQNASKQIQNAVFSLEEYKNCKTVFIFASTQNEPDTFPIMEKILSDKKTLSVPKCLNDFEMEAVIIESSAELETGKYGIKEPKNCSKTISPTDIDLAIIPCLSATKDGKRLGHGNGFYDRFLAKTNCQIICLCFEKLMSDDIPTDEFDIDADIVINENNTVRR